VKIGGAAAVVAILQCFTQPSSAASGQDCGLHALAQLDMSTDASGRVTVPMTVNGQTFNMLVDTGGSLSTVTRSVVSTLNLKQEASSGAYGIYYGGEVIDHYVIVHDATFGGQAIPELRFFVMKDQRVGLADENGTLAPDFLRWFDVDFDFANAKFTLFRQDHCEGQVNYWTRLIPARVEIRLDSNTHLVVPLQLDGKSIDADIDTGAANSTGSLEAFENAFDTDENNKDLKLKSDGDGTFHVYAYPFKNLSFEGVSVQNPEITLSPDRETHMRHKFIIGMNILRHLHLYVAYKEKAIYVTPATAH